MAHRADVDGVRVRRIDRDTRNVVRVLEPNVRPRFAGVYRLVDAIAGERAARREGVAGADPHDVRIGRGGRDRADRELVVSVEDRLERRAVVGRLPQSARPEADVEGVEMLLP